jgi:ABC-type multidrug transport system permease subunit
MGLVILFLILTLLFGGIGLFVTGLKWMLIVALVLLLISAITGSRIGRSHF